MKVLIFAFLLVIAASYTEAAPKESGIFNEVFGIYNKWEVLYFGLNFASNCLCYNYSENKIIESWN